MLSLKTLAASYTLAAKLEPEKCEHMINGLGIKRSTLLDYVYPNNVKVAVVQMKLEPFKDLRAFVQECRRLIEQAVKAGSHLVLFPHLLGLLPLTVDKASCEVATHFIADLAAGRQPKMQLLQRFDQLVERFSDFLFDSYYNIFLLLAHKYNIYIAAGSTYVASSQGIHCRSFLFSPDQREAFFQDKIHLNPMEKKLGLLSGSELKVFELKIGKTALLADCDAQFYECFKVAKSMGAQIVLTPALLSETLSHTPQYNTSLMAAQHYSIYTARASFFSAGAIAPVFEGASGIYAPLSMTKDLDGVICHTQKSKGESTVLCARIEPPKLAENLDIYAYTSNAGFSEVMMNTVYPAYFKLNHPRPDKKAEGPAPKAHVR